MSLEAALVGCERILSGELDTIPESDFYMIGDIEEAIQKNKMEMKKNSNSGKNKSAITEEKSSKNEHAA